MRIPYEEMKSEFKRIFMEKGFNEESAEQAATSFADNSCDGVYSHGVNRFPRVVQYIEKGYIKPNVKATKIGGLGALENWDGHLGLGSLIAKQCMDRAIDLASQYGIGCVAIKNNNHWMRGGAYGWQAANAGCIGICWTNTQPNMPAWGAMDRRIGNNPLIMAIPRQKGHIVVDMAMSQYSYGKIEEYKLKNKDLPVPGGFDSNGAISTDPAEIEKTWRMLPVGFWKGSSLSIVLDLISAVLSGGNTTADVGKLGGDEYALSQVLIAIDPTKLNDSENIEKALDESIEYIKSSLPVSEDGEIYYPGERAAFTREDNLKHGIPVDDEVWRQITST
ncbi:3-dehydro-L-gulonate 2-dehydrogenase [Paenibacillus sp. LHD-38]|uniref:3-dehydro-L-gulonate 2-dehydrogenase n=1 Tax=Paenibacillus sp. LHD-38 TaxID=3072143 RepID=UPI00280ECD87|nr:3-dehydro-L-gulonate 2-dehydrogenase [Paenibacillus sp. LHD-38]MDQ8736199.1 3-dehydro-L-gulonate 2-dehydrogenase [Paenibacillus sp. LHD-38]